MFGFSKTCKCCGKEIMFAFSWTDYVYKRVINKSKNAKGEILFYCGWTCFYKTEPEPEDISQHFLENEEYGLNKKPLTAAEKAKKTREYSKNYLKEWRKRNKEKIRECNRRYEQNKKILEEV